MTRLSKTFALAAVLATGLAAAPALRAHDEPASGDRASSAQGGMMGGGMMGGNMPMMQMMQRMSRMMEGCEKMMSGMTGGHGSGQPDKSAPQRAPAHPEHKG